METYADLALPVGVGKEFTYLVPPELDTAAAVGVRAIVPFGKRYVTGMIVGRPRESSLTRLKPIRDILDSNPLLPLPLLEVCRWVAQYYFAPLGDVLKAAVPHGFRPPAKTYVRITPAGTSFLQRREKQTARVKVLLALSRRGRLATDRLSRLTGVRAMHAILNGLSGEGLVQLEEQPTSPATRPRLEMIVLLGDGDAGRIHEAIAAPPGRRAAQHRLLLTVRDMIAQGRTEIPARDLLSASRTSSTVLARLVTTGVITVVEREVPRGQPEESDEESTRLVLNTPQAEVLRDITLALEAGQSHTFLLHGVTGSGKTQVYIEAIRRCLSLGKDAIVLVPEISLTPQTVRRFRAHFGGQVLVVHSRMSPAERHDVWRRARGGECRVVIGPRSAVFAPVRQLGLVVVDEEQESSYKQFDAMPRYHARDVALVRARISSAVALLGSATPSLESFANARAGKYHLLTIPDRVDGAQLPEVQVINMAEERRAAYRAARDTLEPSERGSLRGFQAPLLSSTLRSAIRERLDRREGVILLQNRRGFAPFVECPDCGFAEKCDNCQVSLTYHATRNHLRCHYCGLVRAPRSACPGCGGPNLLLHGAGTQRVERELAEVFPGAHVLRMDLDTTTRKGAHERLLKQFGSGAADILLGTQMVAKGLDFSRVSLVGVVSADTQMLLPDFRASERTFQLLTQVAGRAGRSSLKGEVIIQTLQPSHPSLRHVVRHDFESFYAEEITAREELAYPPFTRLVLLELKGADEGRVEREAERLFRQLSVAGLPATILGPTPAVLARVRGQYRWHILLKNPRSADPSGSRLRTRLRGALTAFNASAVRAVTLTIDADPVGLM